MRRESTPARKAAAVFSLAPAMQLLRSLELPRQMEMIEKLEMLRDMVRLENRKAAVAPQKVPQPKKPERRK